MYIDIVPNRSSPPAVLLRESSREGGKIRKRTLANLSALPPDAVEVLRRVLKGEKLVGAEASVRVERSASYGHVAAVLGTKRRPERDRVLAMVVARVLAPDSKLATARGLGEESAFSALSDALGLEAVSADSLYRSLDWLLRSEE